MKEIFIPASFGLSNRLYALKYAALLQEHTRLKLVLYWPLSPWLNCEHEQLFSLKTPLIHLVNISQQEFHEKTKGLQNEEISLPTQLNKRDTYLNCKLVNSDGAMLRSHCPPICKVIKINKKIKARVKKFYEENLKEKKPIGIHWRRGDGPFMREPYDISPQIKNSRTRNYFIASDCPRALTQLQKNFPLPSFTKRNIDLAPLQNQEGFKSSTRNTSTGAEDAFIDMILLSKCSKIIGTPGSTFSELATELKSHGRR